MCATLRDVLEVAQRNRENPGCRPHVTVAFTYTSCADGYVVNVSDVESLVASSSVTPLAEQLTVLKKSLLQHTSFKNMPRNFRAMTLAKLSLGRKQGAAHEYDGVPSAPAQVPPPPVSMDATTWGDVIGAVEAAVGRGRDQVAAVAKAQLSLQLVGELVKYLIEAKRTVREEAEVARKRAAHEDQRATEKARRKLQRAARRAARKSAVADSATGGDGDGGSDDVGSENEGTGNSDVGSSECSSLSDEGAEGEEEEEEEEEEEGAVVVVDGAGAEIEIQMEAVDLEAPPSPLSGGAHGGGADADRQWQSPPAWTDLVWSRAKRLERSESLQSQVHDDARSSRARRRRDMSEGSDGVAALFQDQSAPAGSQ